MIAASAVDAVGEKNKNIHQYWMTRCMQTRFQSPSHTVIERESRSASWTARGLGLGGSVVCNNHHYGRLVHSVQLLSSISLSYSILSFLFHSSTTPGCSDDARCAARWTTCPRKWSAAAGTTSALTTGQSGCCATKCCAANHLSSASHIRTRTRASRRCASPTPTRSTNRPEISFQWYVQHTIYHNNCTCINMSLARQ